MSRNQKNLFSGISGLNFDGIRNLPEFIKKEFRVPSGSFMIERVKNRGAGIEIVDKKIWGNENVCLSTIYQLIRQNPDYLPNVYIEEDFRFSFRCFHMAIARGGGADSILT